MFSIFKRNNFVKESYEILDREIWNKYLSKKDFPYLISFPRTGSHWLRNVMELYFEKPSLMRVFFYKNPTDFTCFHIHDEDLLFNEKRRVIYLYRNPVETIYSQMNFYDEDLNDNVRIKYWAVLYGKHLEKWLLKDERSIEKVVLSYENLKNNFDLEFRKLSDFLNEPFDVNKLEKAKKNASKDKIKKKVTDDLRVIKSTNNYDEKRKLFIEMNTSTIEDCILQVNQKLVNFL
ncbi:sulfotransferase domain-containing protein [Urechidicola croceus]|uniref:Sulfotransferase domain-containing protein n=1 Tax=Urechidicola croceus TaxID=1850246 RepID=A0A1D8P4K8_9FLAO|nr:sulfotransferase domain-containing protein [Urechidicola croceus]AOW19498.1 hypothetical protein LPB138_01850 [Urechidicola croceus]